MTTKINALKGLGFLILYLFLGSCVKENITIPKPALTYTIEDVTVNGTLLKKISGRVNESLSLGNTYQYLLSGIVSIEDSLMIEKGTIFYADTSKLTSLVLQRGAIIVAEGSIMEPIVFTSVKQLSGTAQAGDWGGIHINGKASLNNRRSSLVELIGKYGRTDMAANDLDMSGTLDYIRIEYAGKEMNGESGAFNLNGVGNTTLIRHIQVYKSASNAIRCRGGAVNLKFMMVTQPAGKGIRWDDGWRGFGQYWVVNFNESINDTITAIEGRSGTINDFPISSPILSNITIVGLGQSLESPPVRGVRFRNATFGKMYNSIITNCQRGIRADYSLPYITNGNLVFSNNNIFNTMPIYYSSSSSIADIFGLPQYNNTSDFILMDTFIGVSSNNVFDISTIHPWFDNVSFKGAVHPDNNWTLSWTR